MNAKAVFVTAGNLTYQINQRKRVTIMSNNQKPNTNKGKAVNPQAVTNATTILAKHMADLHARIDAATGEEKVKLEKEMSDVMASIGMRYTGTDEGPLPGAEGDAAPRDISKVIPGISALYTYSPNKTAETETTVDATVEVKTETTEGEGWWARTKAFFGRHWGKLVIGLGVVGAAVGIYAYLRNPAATTATAPASLARGVAEAAADTAADVATEAAPEAAGFFATIGKWISSGWNWVATKASNFWNWLKGLFTKAEAEVQVGADAAAA